MGLIERLQLIWLGPACNPERCWSSVPIEDCDDCGDKAVKYVVATALDKLRGYTVHRKHCLNSSNRDMPCSCGLAALLKEIGGD